MSTTEELLTEIAEAFNDLASGADTSPITRRVAYDNIAAALKQLGTQMTDLESRVTALEET